MDRKVYVKWMRNSIHSKETYESFKGQVRLTDDFRVRVANVVKNGTLSMFVNLKMF